MLPVQYQMKNLNHLGLVAGMCRELKIAEYFDACITNDSDARNVTIGQAVVAMIINGLGFTGQALYLVPEFFADKPVDRLIAEGIQAEHLNDRILGRALDSLYDAGVSDLYLNLGVSSCYGGVKQRWVLFLNEKRRLSEQKTLTRKIKKKSLNEARNLEKLGKKGFLCQHDALKAFAQWQKQSELCQSEEAPELISKPRYHKKGRPAPDSKPDYFEYFVQATCFVACEKRETAQAALGCFILGTNDLNHDLNQDSLNARELLSTYKSQQQSQQQVKNGFRFLKSPDFLVSSLYLEKAERIEALLMVMTLCLMVYADIQHRIRHELKRQSRFFPNQKKKLCQNPTAKWVFYCFQGVSLLTVNNQEHLVIGLQERQWTIIQILGVFFEAAYS